MLFIISVVFAVLGFFMAFFGITYQTFTTHPKRVKALKWGLGICLSISMIFAYLETESDKDKNDKQRLKIERMSVVDSISQLEIIRLREESRNYNMQLSAANKAHADSLRSYHRDDVQQIQSTAYNMTKIFAQESKNNAQQHQKTQSEISKIDTKLRPAHISFLPEPSNCFVVSFSENTLTMSVRITNSGDKIAYGLSWVANVVLESKDGKFYRYPITDLPVKHGLDMSSNLSRSIELKRPLPDWFYANLINIYVVVNGYYYDDELLKKKKDFVFAGKREINDPIMQTYSIDKDIMDFYNDAIKLY